MRSARRLMLVNICMKFHEGILNGFWVTERTRPYRKIYYFQFQRAITPKIRNPELRFLRSPRRIMLLYICVKFHENISNGFWVTERTRFCDRQTDARANIWGLGASLSMIMRFIPLRIHWVALKPIFVYVLGATSLWEFNMEVAHKPKMLERADGRTDVQTTRAKTMSPNPTGVDITN